MYLIFSPLIEDYPAILGCHQCFPSFHRINWYFDRREFTYHELRDLLLVKFCQRCSLHWLIQADSYFLFHWLNCWSPRLCFANLSGPSSCYAHQWSDIWSLLFNLSRWRPAMQLAFLVMSPVSCFGYLRILMNFRLCLKVLSWCLWLSRLSFSFLRWSLRFWDLIELLILSFAES